MTRPAVMVLRGILFLAIVTIVPALLNDGRRPASPYLSALSQIGGADVRAQVACNDKGCISGGRYSTNCGHLPGYYCYKYHGSSCSTGSCS